MAPHEDYGKDHREAAHKLQDCFYSYVESKVCPDELIAVMDFDGVQKLPTRATAGELEAKRRYLLGPFRFSPPPLLPKGAHYV